MALRFPFINVLLNAYLFLYSVNSRGDFGKSVCMNTYISDSLRARAMKLADNMLHKYN